MSRCRCRPRRRTVFSQKEFWILMIVFVFPGMLAGWALFGR